MTDQKRIDWIEIILISLATGLFAADLCFIAPTLLQSVDYVFMWKPMWQFFRDSVREGGVPLWNPYIGLGRPFLADVGTSVFYPPLYLICLGPRIGLFFLVWLHCLLAVFGMRRLSDVLQVGRPQTYFMALCFLGSGAMTARWTSGQIPFAWALCYAPWLFYCAARTSEPWNARRLAMYALVLAAQFLCGNPHVFWFLTVGQAVFIVGRVAGASVREALAGGCRGLAQFAVAGAWCGGLVAAVLLPFAELVKQSNRNLPSPALANFLKLEWIHLGSLVFPVGIVPDQSPFYWEMNLFVGILVVILGVAGLCRVREPNARGLLAVLIVALLIALGSSTPAFRFFYYFLPGFSSLRAHSRAGFLVAFALICAAGIWLSRPHPHLSRGWPGKLNISPRFLFLSLFLLQTVDLLRALPQMKQVYSYNKHYHSEPDFPLERSLVNKLTAAGLLQKLQPPPRVSVPGQLVPANDAMMHRYANSDAAFPLYLRRDWDYLHRVLGLTPSELINTHLPDPVYQRTAFPYPDLALSVGFDPDRETLILDTNTSPRAFLVYATEVIPDYDAALNRLANGHDIHRSALLEKPLDNPLRSDNTRPAALAHIRRFETDSLLVDVDAKEDALLVLAEAWYPGWRAEIDGHVSECVPANIWMRSVPIPAGKHQVRIYFHQDYLLPGLMMSAISALALVLALIFGRRQKLEPKIAWG